MRYAYGAGAIVLFIVAVLVMRGLIGSAVWIVALAALAFFGWIYRDRISAFVRRKLGEWQNDLKQLGLWTRLAFTRNRDAHATATMTHQMQFLQGRMMSPMNLFAIAALVIFCGIGGLSFEEWRIGRLKRERDAPCAEHEVERNDRGDFRTTRAACAALGATQESARAWRARAIEEEAGRIRDVATARLESDEQLRLAQQRIERTEAAQRRQRRRDNEAIASAIGGPAPDLDRSLCELAGRVDCTASGSEAGSAAPTPADGLPSAAGDGDAARDPTAAIGNPRP